MSTILITGTSGFIGRALAASLADQHKVIGLSRKPTPVEGITAVEGDFTDPEKLHSLDPHGDIDVVVHLAAVVGRGSEADCIGVNVAGTHRMLRHCIDRGTRRFVLASSIAAVGMQSTRFRPLQLPMPDEHPCVGDGGYGFSKYLPDGGGHPLPLTPERGPRLRQSAPVQHRRGRP